MTPSFSIATHSRRLLAATLLLCAVRANASDKLPSVTPTTVDALLVSDIHFDPFWDPARTPQLAQANVAHWAEILDQPTSPGQPEAFAAIQKKCGPGLTDTSPILFRSSLNAIRSHAQALAFAMVTGDLLVHDYSCRFTAALPAASPEEQRQFLEKTEIYVIRQLSAALPGKPVYIALGNNDSECGDYRLNDHDRLFGALAAEVARAARAPASSRIAEQFREHGSFSTLLPTPLQQTKIVALDDLPQSRRYQPCAAEPQPVSRTEQLAWLRSELEAARRHRQTVWLISHIPPGIYPEKTLLHRDVCLKRDPTELLADDGLAALLLDYPDVLRMTLFAHTHMDELRILRSEESATGIPMKIVPSISPIAQNPPSFLIASIDAATSEMLDYTQYAQSSTQPNDWPAQYSFRATYRQTSLSAAALDQFVRKLESDATGSSPDVQSYIQLYSGGSTKFGIQSVWSGYRCLLDRRTTADFLACACPATPETKEKP